MLSPVKGQTKSPRMHHYLPRFYLAGFSDPRILNRENKEAIWVYEKNKSVRRSTPEKEGRERDFYAFQSEDGENFEVEKMLGGIENAVAPIIERLRNVRYVLSVEERQSLGLFVGTMQTRTPFARSLDEKIEPVLSRMLERKARDPAAFRSLWDTLFPETGTDTYVEQIRMEILDDRNFQRPEYKLESALVIGQMRAEALLQFDWQIVYADESESFVTSDNPIIAGTWKQTNGEWGIRHFKNFDVPDLDIFFPLTRRICMRMKKSIEPGPYHLPARGVRSVNKLTMACAQRWLYASKRSQTMEDVFNKEGCTVPIESFEFTWEGLPL